jgi:hypothetical protein
MDSHPRHDERDARDLDDRGYLREDDDADDGRCRGRSDTIGAYVARGNLQWRAGRRRRARPRRRRDADCCCEEREVRHCRYGVGDADRKRDDRGDEHGQRRSVQPAS